ncbi:hypothetical protein V6N12_019528 [Hibiscus sabdariffa]|uniref:Uncharacterized protein n=1 Tax=Hibiscus sabdariffa TaxID=183260 RepID=A0ABR2BMJ6_9ROSI
MLRIDDAVERILRVKFVAALLEYPDRSLLDTVGCKLHRELAREAVRKSLVLLKKNAKRVLIAGTYADDLGYPCVGWTRCWQGSSGRITIGTSILDAFREVMGEKTEVIYEKYPSPNTLAASDFSFAIVAVGEEPYAEYAGDNSELVIPLNGSELMYYCQTKK